MSGVPWYGWFALGWSCCWIFDWLVTGIGARVNRRKLVHHARQGVTKVELWVADDDARSFTRGQVVNMSSSDGSDDAA